MSFFTASLKKRPAQIQTRNENQIYIHHAGHFGSGWSLQIGDSRLEFSRFILITTVCRTRMHGENPVSNKLKVKTSERKVINSFWIFKRCALQFKYTNLEPDLLVTRTRRELQLGSVSDFLTSVNIPKNSFSFWYCVDKHCKTANGAMYKQFSIYNKI